ncbi:MAG: DNA repair exonuclease [Bryobacteraceae bacterium]|jgi:DNA repair exonuclease SbcCD nuclease subunit
MRLIHSSDLQIGKVFMYFEPEVAAVLQDARQAAVRTLGELAVKHEASAVLLAGDIYDKQQLSPKTLGKPIEAMRQFPKVAWYLMPGNHDHLRENGLWDRLARANLPQNVHLHTKPGAMKIMDDDGRAVFLLPAPLTHTAYVDDLTAYMDKEPTPEGAVRIGMAHGSIQGFGSDGDASNYVNPNRAETAGLAYLAMGDWHRQMQINGRVWYSGTPEPDLFKRQPGSSGTLCNGGLALLVDIAGPRALPEVSPLEVGQYRWHQVEKTLAEDSQVDLLEAELRALEPDLSKVVLDLQVAGALSLAGRKIFEEKIIQGVGAGVRAMRCQDDGLVLEPTEADLDDIDRAGFVRVAADRLKALAEDGSDPPRARLASLALRRLYIEHLLQA